MHARTHEPSHINKHAQKERKKERGGVWWIICSTNYEIKFLQEDSEFGDSLSSNAFIEDQQREASHRESDVTRKYKSYYRLNSPNSLPPIFLYHVERGLSTASPWQLATFMFGSHLVPTSTNELTCYIIWINGGAFRFMATILCNVSSQFSY